VARSAKGYFRIERTLTIFLGRGRKIENGRKIGKKEIQLLSSGVEKGQEETPRGIKSSLGLAKTGHILNKT
jgi:hypothetical protein